MENLEFQILYHPERFGMLMRFGRISGGYGSGKARVGRVEFVEVDIDHPLPEVFGFEVSRDELQCLSDMLWREGFRPRACSECVTKEIHDATKNHLEDLRYMLKIGGGVNG